MLSGFSYCTFFQALVDSSSLPNQNCLPFKSLWTVGLPTTVSSLLVIHKKSNSCDVLQERRHLTSLSPSCCLCKKDAENLDHIIVHCDIALFIWRRVFEELGIMGMLPKKGIDMLNSVPTHQKSKVEAIWLHFFWLAFGTFGLKGTEGFCMTGRWRRRNCYGKEPDFWPLCGCLCFHNSNKFHLPRSYWVGQLCFASFITNGCSKDIVLFTVYWSSFRRRTSCPLLCTSFLSLIKLLGSSIKPKEELATRKWVGWHLDHLYYVRNTDLKRLNNENLFQQKTQLAQICFKDKQYKSEKTEKREELPLQMSFQNFKLPIHPQVSKKCGLKRKKYLKRCISKDS